MEGPNIKLARERNSRVFQIFDAFVILFFVFINLNLRIWQSHDIRFKKSQWRQKAKQPVQVVKKPQTIDAKKTMNINDIQGSATLSQTSEDEKDNDSVPLADLNASMLDLANFEATISQMDKWIASIRTSLRPASGMR